MNIRWNTLCLGGFLALTSPLAQPVMADDWNKRTEFQFSAPVEVPGKVLAPGKYIFQLMDSDSDRNIVQIFLQDSTGKETLVTTILAIPDDLQDTPDKPIIHFEERRTDSPEAIHSWYYPGESTGWAFVYPKDEILRADVKTATISTPAATGTAPSLPPAPKVQAAVSAPQATLVAEQTVVAQANPPAPPTAPEVNAHAADSDGTADRILPETAGRSHLELFTGIAMLLAGSLALIGVRRRSLV